MNTDIRLSVGFWQHPKTRKMEKNLGIKGVRSLQILWAWVAQNRSDGELSGMDWEDIELAADWRGKKGAFFNYCLGIWIDGEDGAYSIHDWKEHNEWASEDEERRDKARFSRLAKVNPQAFEKLRLQGINAISKDDYKRLTSVERPFDDPLTSVERPFDDPLTSVERPFDDCLTPSPAPDIKKLNTPPFNPPASGGKTDASRKPESQDPSGEAVTQPEEPAVSGPESQPAKPPKSYPADFCRFWEKYPKKVGKDQAFRVWRRRKRDLPAIEELCAVLERHCHCEQWRRDGGQYIPNPATWLNQGRWQDAIEVETWTPKPANW